MRQADLSGGLRCAILGAAAVMLSLATAAVAVRAAGRGLPTCAPIDFRIQRTGPDDDAQTAADPRTRRHRRAVAERQRRLRRSALRLRDRHRHLQNLQMHSLNATYYYECISASLVWLAQICGTDFLSVPDCACSALMRISTSDPTYPHGLEPPRTVDLHVPLCASNRVSVIFPPIIEPALHMLIQAFRYAAVIFVIWYCRPSSFHASQAPEINFQ